MKWKIFYLLLFVFLLAACGADTPPEVAEPEIVAPTVVDSSTDTEVATGEDEVMDEEMVETVAEATAVPTPIPPTEVPAEVDAVEEAEEPEPVAETESAEAVVEEPTAVAVEEPVAETAVNVIAGRTSEGAFFLGDPNAPVTMIDYSDFL